MPIDSKITDSFNRQGLMTTIGARLVSAADGLAEIHLPYSPALTQQHGYFHAAAITAIADTAGGYAALSLMEADDDVLAAEFKINLLRPAVGERLIARAEVVKSGRTLSICHVRVVAVTGENEKLVAMLTQTNARMRP